MKATVLAEQTVAEEAAKTHLHSHPQPYPGKPVGQPAHAFACAFTPLPKQPVRDPQAWSLLPLYQALSAM